MKYVTTMKMGLYAGAIGALPLPLSVAAAIKSEMEKLKAPAYLAAMIGYHYKWYPNANIFKDKFPVDAMVVFSKVDIPKAGAAVAADRAISHLKR